MLEVAGGSGLDQQVALQFAGVALVNGTEPVRVCLLDVVLQRSRQRVRLVDCLLVLTAADEVVGGAQQLRLAFQTARESLGPGTGAGVVGVQVVARRVAALVKLFLDAVDVLHEDLEHMRRLLLDRALDVLTLGKVVECLEHVHTGGDSRDAVKRNTDDILHHDLEVLDSVFESVVVVVPLGCLDIQDVVLQHAQVLNQTVERELDINQRLGDLSTLGATEGKLFLVARTLRELNLALAHLQQVSAALHKRIDLREDARLVKVPRVGRVLLNKAGSFAVDCLPLVAGFDRLLQHCDAALHVAVEDFLETDPRTATVNDFVRNLTQQPGESLRSVVVPTESPNHADQVENAGQQRGNVLGVGFRQFLARQREGRKKLEVVLRLQRTLLDTLGEIVERVQV
mmetsp:Transcript_21536/g.50674  ORF Transcript_21536/g.50674 Transcript_21536/m.50674 type:complete len:399 (+) Transcript_21536:11414-12610(+)